MDDLKQPGGKSLSRALEFVRDRWSQLQSLVEREPYTDDYLRWENVASSGLAQYFGRDSEEYRWVFPKLTRPNVISGRSQSEIDQREREHYAQRIRDKGTGLKSILEKYESTPAASRLAFWHPVVSASQSLLKRLLSWLAALPRLAKWVLGLVVAGAVSGLVGYVLQQAL